MRGTVTTPEPPVATATECASAIAEIRACLDANGFDEAGVCERTGAPSIYEFTPLSKGERPRLDVEDARDALIRLFLDSETLPASVVARLLGDAAASFLEARLLAQRGDGSVGATVLLYPAGPVRLVSDLREACRPTDRGYDVPDAVYPAITPNTRLFVAGLPNGRCERLIELCGGTGVGALLGAADAGHAWSADITGRATRFAEFNAALNGITNFSAVCGDLLEPVRGMTFDRIIAHPPYVPAIRQELIFRDGGADGEQVTRRIIGSLGDFLEPGGMLYCTCSGTDRKGAAFEHRVREMLGPVEADFDIVFVSASVNEADSYCADLLVDAEMPREEAEHTRSIFRRLEVENVLVGSIVIRRHASPAPALTLRKPMGETPAAAAADFLLWWERAGTNPEVRARLLESRPRVAESVTREISQRKGPDGWVVASCRYSVQLPFPLSLEPSGAAMGFIERCDGVTTVREHVDRLRQEGRIADSATTDGFVDVIRTLAESGILALGDGWPAASN